MDEPNPREAVAPIDPMTCLRCGARLESYGEHEFKTGGSAGATAHFILGAFASLGEDHVRLVFLGCQSCGNVEFRMPSR